MTQYNLPSGLVPLAPRDRVYALRALCDLVSVVHRNPHFWVLDACTPRNSGKLAYADRAVRTQMETLGFYGDTVLTHDQRKAANHYVGRRMKQFYTADPECDARLAHIILRHAGLGGLTFVNTRSDGRPYQIKNFGTLAWILKVHREARYQKAKEALNAGRSGSKKHELKFANPYSIANMAKALGIATSTFARFEGVLDPKGYANDYFKNPEHYGPLYQRGDNLNRMFVRELFKKLKLHILDKWAQMVGLGGITALARPDVQDVLFIPEMFSHQELMARWPTKYGPGKQNLHMRNRKAFTEADGQWHPHLLAKPSFFPLLDRSLSEVLRDDAPFSERNHPIPARPWCPPAIADDESED